MTDRVSNVDDFTVAAVCHGGRTMQGVISRRVVRDEDLPLFVGVYTGYLRTAAEVDAKVASYRSRHGVVGPIAYARATGYNLCADEDGGELDPTDPDGSVLPEFAHHVALFVNEPSPSQRTNAVLGLNESTGRLELWLCEPVDAGEEVLTWYGDDYERDYDVARPAVHS